MELKPRKKRVRGGILIILSKTDTIEQALGDCIKLFDVADTNDANWSPAFENLADVIENEASAVQANDFTSGDWANTKGAIDDALEAYKNE